jgi:hypothetical protein
MRHPGNILNRAAMLSQCEYPQESEMILGCDSPPPCQYCGAEPMGELCACWAPDPVYIDEDYAPVDLEYAASLLPAWDDLPDDLSTISLAELCMEDKNWEWIQKELYGAGWR